MSITASIFVIGMLISAFAQEHRDRPAKVSVGNGCQASKSIALNEFLKRFDCIAERGFVTTLRAGPTGVGYTLESLLKIEENNSPQGDFHGMEIKAYRDSESRFDDHEKMNLFLKEPAWLDGMKSADRIKAYGYVDENGRQAWYQSVTSRVNSSGLRLQVDRASRVVRFLRDGAEIGQWSYDVLEKRLLEKHSETVFVAAETRGEGNAEQFHYRTVTYCAAPSVTRFVKLIEEGDVILELRMHINRTGGARNHGSAFRVRKHRLVDLYREQTLYRPVAAG